jgi:DnaJ family protein C protein 3
VLDVPRDADARTIKKAYRKATKKHHPDKEGGSESAMASVNEAYEVLSNPELRARFDNGDDPNDPHAGAGGGQGGGFHHQGGGGGHPFYGSPQGGQQFFHQFFQGGAAGGGGSHHQKQQFKFHFG